MSSLKLALLAATVVAIVTPAQANVREMLKSDQGTWQVVVLACADQVSADRIENCSKHVYMMCVQAGGVSAKAQCISERVRGRR